MCNSLDFFSLQGINIVGPSNAEPTPRPPSPAMYQLDIILKKGNNLAIRDRTGRSSVCSSYYISSIKVYGGDSQSERALYPGLSPPLSCFVRMQDVWGFIVTILSIHLLSFRLSPLFIYTFISSLCQCGVSFGTIFPLCAPPSFFSHFAFFSLLSLSPRKHGCIK